MTIPGAYIWLHPGRQHGAPCIGGTRIDVGTITRLVWGQGGSVQLAIASYPHLTREQVLVACWYEAVHGAHMWGRRWGGWVDAYESAMWSGRWAGIPDPPNTGSEQR